MKKEAYDKDKRIKELETQVDILISILRDRSNSPTYPIIITGDNSWWEWWKHNNQITCSMTSTY